MKNYDETIRSVFDRMNAYEVEKRRKRKIMTKTATSLCCCTLVALLGVGMWQNGMLQTPPPVTENGSDSSQPETDMNKESDKTDEIDSDNSEIINLTPDAPVIWGESDDTTDSMGYTHWNGKRITLSLYGVLSDEKTSNSLIAIGVGFELDNNFVYNGKSLAEYEADADYEHLLYGRLGTLLKIGDSLKYGEALYTTGGPNGEKWAKELYDETVETIGKDVLAKYIVNGEFLKEKLEADIVEYGKYTPCHDAYETACEAYFQSAIDTAMEQLEKQNIRSERSSHTGLVLYATADELASLALDNVMYYCLALKNGEGEDLAEPSVDDIVTSF